jgi:hypothetical protein
VDPLLPVAVPRHLDVEEPEKRGQRLHHVDGLGLEQELQLGPSMRAISRTAR